jgi:hypothetical protein
MEKVPQFSSAVRKVAVDEDLLLIGSILALAAVALVLFWLLSDGLRYLRLSMGPPPACGAQRETGLAECSGQMIPELILCADLGGRRETSEVFGCNRTEP